MMNGALTHVRPDHRDRRLPPFGLGSRVDDRNVYAVRPGLLQEAIDAERHGRQVGRAPVAQEVLGSTRQEDLGEVGEGVGVRSVDPVPQ